VEANLVVVMAAVAFVVIVMAGLVMVACFLFTTVTFAVRLKVTVNVRTLIAIVLSFFIAVLTFVVNSFTYFKGFKGVMVVKVIMVC